uniref:Integrase, catalytic region, zinc finger, CCHC-type, peptidase aspartic, catalytic n=1 Tax=Tanacetum cinerariifolium TaxID=118510 RepID=A0A6L2J9C6_TANCI|nr:hypothetical protein [Tanacetum cinerariifolium]
MDSIISLGQKNTLAAYMILFGADNRLPILDKDLVAKDLWERVQLLMQGDDPIACLNKAMDFLTVVTSLSGQKRVVKCYNYQGDGHMARQCTQPKQPRNAAWYKEKAMLAKAQLAGQMLDEEQLTKDLDTYDSDCDDLSTAQAVLMANISNYGFEVILEAQQDLMILSVIEQMSEHMINHVNNWEKANKEHNNESITAELERCKERGKTFEQRLNIDLKIKPTLYDGIVNFEKHVAMHVIDDEETLILEEESRSKMSKKGKDLEAIKQNISHKPIDYEKLNRLTEDFGKRFTPQQELSSEQAFWLRISNPTIESSYIPPIKVEVPSELPRSESCEHRLNLDAEFSKSKQAYDALLKNYSQLEKHCISLELSIQLNQEIFQKNESCIHQNAPEIPEYFEKNDLKAQLQDKDTTICKLEDTIKSMRNNNKEEIVDHDRCDLATINEELENKNEDLKAQIKDKVFVITSLINDLGKLKGKSTVDNTAQIPSATIVALGMFKLDLEPLAPKLVHNREIHVNYLKHTQEQADIL